MSQSSPKGIILGKGSKLISVDLSIEEKKVLSMKRLSIEKAAKEIYPDNGYKDELYCDLSKYIRNFFIEGVANSKLNPWV